MKNLQVLKRRIRLLVIVAAIIIIGVPALARLSLYAQSRGSIYSNIAKVPHQRVALVLGTQVYPNGKLSARLRSRCDKAVDLYKAGKVDKLLMSGDGSKTGHGESQHMRNYAVRRGVPAGNIVIDLYGLRTYDSMYRARHIYGLRKFTVVTQGFHLDRSLYLCRAVGVNAVGVPADLPGDLRDKLREPMACVMAMIDTYLLKPQPVMGKKQRI